MRNYEIAYIADPDLDEQGLTALEDKVKGWLEAAGAKISKVDHWGKRRMAYEIDDHHDGVYTFVYAEMPPSAGVDVERDLRLSEQVLRYMIILQDA